MFYYRFRLKTSIKNAIIKSQPKIKTKKKKLRKPNIQNKTHRSEMKLKVRI